MLSYIIIMVNVNIVDNERESFTKNIEKICWNFIDSPPDLPKHKGRDLKFGCLKDKKILIKKSNKLSCDACKLYWKQFLSVKKTDSKKDLLEIDRKHRWKFAVTGIQNGPPYNIKLKNGIKLKLADHFKNLYPEDIMPGILYVGATYISYFHFQSYINPNNDLEAKVEYRKRLKAMIEKKDFKDEWHINPSDIYMFEEEDIVTIEINLMLYLTGMSVEDLNKKFVCREKNVCEEETITDKNKGYETDYDDMPNLIPSEG